MMRLPVKLVNLLVNATLKILAVLRLNTPNRIVVALSPLFMSASGAILALVAHYLPAVGHHLTSTELMGLFITGAMLGSTKLLMWLRGWQQHEARSVTPPAPAPPPPAPPAPPPRPAIHEVGTL